MKKFFCLAMSIMLLSSSVAFANDNMQHDIDIKEEINRALNGISDIPVSQELKDKVTARLVDSNGEQIEVETYYTVREIPNNTRSFSVQNTGTQYIMTAVARAKSKEEYDSTRKRGIDVLAYGYLRWTDGFASNNTLDSVSGGWIEEKQSKVTGNRKVTYGRYGTGLSGTASTITRTKRPSNDTFNYSVNDIEGVNLFFNTFADVTNGATNARLELRINA